MSTSRIARMEALFHAALELPPGERSAFLVVEEPDVDLRAAVERLLTHHVDGDLGLRDVLHAAVAHTPPTRARIGSYELLREIGAGGMGTVFLAERHLGDTRQQVALKLIRGFPTRDARARLARERALLGELNHPNIASLLDGGDSEDGQPYIVMEYVDGTALLAWCEQHAPGVDARLALFVQLCRAVQHAHQRLVVHRDIKPANVIVREDGTPVLLDFGIGKLLDATDRNATSTRVFTPAYAAPEQIAGRMVTTATDIYGLGCVLYELLSGRALTDVNADGRLPPPSVASGNSMRARLLRGDLDTLVGKAMHVEPEHRYASVQALADDVENYRNGRPLRAAPDSAAYRARKFIARHRYAAFAVAMFCALVAAFVWRLNAERQRALDAEAQTLREVQSTRRSRDFLVSLFEAAAPSNTLGHALTARELIDKGSEHLQQELKDEPQLAARVGQTIAEVYAALGDPNAAIKSGERALALATGDTADVALQRSYILLALANQYDNTERFEDARHADEQALALRERHAPDDHVKIGAALAESGAAAVRRAEYPAARAFLDRAMAEYAKVPEIDPVERSATLRELAQLDDAEGKATESLLHAQQSVQALADLPAGSPARIEAWRMLATAQISNADPVGASTTLEHALAVANAAVGEDSLVAANVENDLAVALNPQGRYREAIAHLEKSIAITERLRPGAHVATAYSLNNLGSLYESLGDYAKAESLMRAGIAAIEAESPDESQLDSFRSNLARTLMFRGDLAGARALIERALLNIAARDGERSFLHAFQTFRLARLELAAGNLADATRDLDDAVHVLDGMLPPQHPVRVQFNALRGMIAKEAGDLPAAQRELEAAELAQAALPGADPVLIATIRMRLAAVLVARGQLPAARQKLDLAMPVLEASLLPTAVERRDGVTCRAELVRQETITRR